MNEASHGQVWDSSRARTKQPHFISGQQPSEATMNSVSRPLIRLDKRHIEARPLLEAEVAYQLSSFTIHQEKVLRHNPYIYWIILKHANIIEYSHCSRKYVSNWNLLRYPQNPSKNLVFGLRPYPLPYLLYYVFYFTVAKLSLKFKGQIFSYRNRKIESK